MAYSTSFCICGAGIIGLSLARELIKRGVDDILIIEKEQALGQHASGRNSGVLHAGIYYAPHSLRAKICIKGNEAMRQYCKAKELPLLESGKVIVTRHESELPALHELYKRACQNKARAQYIDPKELAEIEPEAQTQELAIFSPLSAQVDPHAVLNALQQELQASGKVRFLFNSAFLSKKGAKSILTTADSIHYEYFINTAGAYADTIAKHFGLGKNYMLVPFKGLYRKMKKEHNTICRGSIYPVPDIRNPFLGVHFTRSVYGEVYLGPTAIPAFSRENYGIFSGLTLEAPYIALQDMKLFCKNPKFRQIALSEPQKYFAKAFFNEAKRLVKNLPANALEPSPKVGIRPQLISKQTHELLMDFVLESNEQSLHVLNAISPAFTAAFPFAKIIADKIFSSV